MLWGAGGKLWHTPLSFQPNREKKSLQASLPGRRAQACAPRRGGRERSLQSCPPPSGRSWKVLPTRAGSRSQNGAPSPRERAGNELGVRDAETRQAAAPSAQYPAPDRVSGGGALHWSSPPQPGADKALGSEANPGRRPRAKLTRLGRRGGPAGGVARHWPGWCRCTRCRPAAARCSCTRAPGSCCCRSSTCSASSRPPASRRERRGGAADPGLGAPQPGSSAPAPGTCTITPAQSPPLSPAGPAPPFLLLLLRYRLPQPRASTALSPRHPKAGAQLVGRGLGRRGVQWGSARRNRVADGTANRNCALGGWTTWGSNHGQAVGPGQAWPALWRPKRGALLLPAIPINAISPPPSQVWALGWIDVCCCLEYVWILLQSQVLHSATPWFPPSREQEWYEITIPAPAECRHLLLWTRRLPPPALYPKSARPGFLSALALLFWRTSVLQKLLK